MNFFPELFNASFPIFLVQQILSSSSFVFALFQPLRVRITSTRRRDGSLNEGPRTW